VSKEETKEKEENSNEKKEAKNPKDDLSNSILKYLVKKPKEERWYG